MVLEASCDGLEFLAGLSVEELGSGVVEGDVYDGFFTGFEESDCGVVSDVRGELCGACSILDFGEGSVDFFCVVGVEFDCDDAGPGTGIAGDFFDSGETF